MGKRRGYVEEESWAGRQPYSVRDSYTQALSPADENIHEGSKTGQQALAHLGSKDSSRMADLSLPKTSVTRTKRNLPKYPLFLDEKSWGPGR